jgi:hypothetical protein
MICQICQEPNDSDDIFCRQCGNSLGQGTEPTVILNTPVQPIPVQPTPFHNSQMFPTSVPSKSNHHLLYGIIGALLCVLVGGATFLGFTLLKKNKPLPSHFGIFARQNDALKELPKKEIKDFIKEKDGLLNQDGNPALTAKPEIIVFSDAGIPVDKLKLVNLDSVKNDGSYQFADFQISPVEGKPEMKELRPANNLANGNYAFVIFEGFLNEGNHQFWTFQITDSETAETASLQSANLGLKPTPTPTPRIEIPPPPGSRVGICNNRNVMLRSSASLYGSPVGKLNSGQTVYVLEISSNYDYWNGIYSNWAFVQLPTGKRGWMFHHFVTYR